jgi:hypothetical protein
MHRFGGSGELFVHYVSSIALPISLSVAITHTHFLAIYILDPYLSLFRFLRQPALVAFGSSRIPTSASHTTRYGTTQISAEPVESVDILDLDHTIYGA